MLAQLTRRVLGPTLSANEAESFRRDGVLGPFTAISPLEASEACRVITSQVLTTPTPYSGYHHRIRHLDSSTVYQLCAAPAIVKRLIPLFGPDLLLWYSVLFDKPPAKPGAQEMYPWHQDQYNWNLEPMITVSAWLALTPATLENGCVEVIPGSHRMAVPMTQDSDERYASHFGGRVADPAFIDESKARPMVLQPGQFFLFNERTVHRSGPNLTQERRIGLSIRVTVPFVKTYEEWPSILLCGKDRCGVNPLASPPGGEPNVADWPNGLPRGREFLFDSPPPGLGWHLPEANDSARWAWTGPETSSWISVWPRGSGKHMFRCHIRTAIADDVLTGLEVWLDDTRLDLAWRPTSPGVEVSAPVRPTLLQENRPVRLTLRVPRTVRACDQNSASTDTRRLGLAIGRIGLVPAHW